jgi:Mrp family chromosome partitioning ATPase
MVLPAEAATVHSSELMGARTMDTMLQDIKKSFRSRIVIFDMPPLLQGDEVLALLPRIDCVLLVAAAGVSTQQQIIECNKHLQSTEVVRLVLNKSNEPSTGYYY